MLRNSTLQINYTLNTQKLITTNKLSAPYSKSNVLNTTLRQEEEKKKQYKSQFSELYSSWVFTLADLNKAKKKKKKDAKR